MLTKTHRGVARRALSNAWAQPVSAALRAATAVVGVAMVSGCAMFGSSLSDVSGTTDPYKVACRSNAGAYFLPKTMFRVSVIKRIAGEGTVNEQSWYELEGLQAIRRSDGTKPYCLDYLASSTSEDEINVVKYTGRLVRATPGGAVDLEKARAILPGLIPASVTTANTLGELGIQLDSNLLRYVASDAIDQSAYILNTLIKSVFLGVAGSQAKSAGLAQAADGMQRVIATDYDPFDVRQTAIINDTLKDFGFCIVVEAGTFDPARSTVSRYCDNPKAFLRRSSDFAEHLDARRFHNEVKQTQGILYRPRIPYNVYVFVKDDLRRSGGWRLRKSEVVGMENISPILSVGVDRTFFAQRKTALVFDQGTLTNVCIYKTSEFQKFAEVPLEVVKSVVSLPTTIIQLRIINTNNDAKLIAAQEHLIAKNYTALKSIKEGFDSIPGEPGQFLQAVKPAVITDVDTVAPGSETFQQRFRRDFDSACPNPKRAPVD